MKNDILSIEVARKDLEPTSEYWQRESYETVKTRLQNLIKEKTGFYPFANTKIIRKLSFAVPPTTTLQQVKDLFTTLEKNFGLECFEANIDREQAQANLLLISVDQTTGHAMRWNNKSKVKMLSAFFLRRLRLPYPKDNGSWIRYVLLDAYTANDAIFQQLYKNIEDGNIESGNKSIIKDIFTYVELMSKGKVK